MGKWLSKYSLHGASGFHSSIPTSHMGHAWPRCQTKKWPKNLLPNGGSLMVQSICLKKKTNPKEQNCPTKQPAPQNSRYLRGGSGFCCLPYHHTTINIPVRLRSPHWPCWCHIIAPNCSSKGSDQRAGLSWWGKNTIFVYSFWKLDEWIPNKHGLEKAISGIYVKFRVCRPTGMSAWKSLTILRNLVCFAYIYRTYNLLI